MLIPGIVSSAMKDFNIVEDHNGSLGKLLVGILYSDVIKNSKWAMCREPNTNLGSYICLVRKTLIILTDSDHGFN